MINELTMTGTTAAMLVLQLLALLLGPVTAAGSTSGVSFIRSPQPIVAPPGDRVVFECETNVPPERVVWLHNGVEVSSGSSTNPTTVSSSPPSSDGGLRRKGRNAAVGEGAAASFRLREPGGGSSKTAVHLVRISRNPQRYRQQAGDYQCVAWFGAVALTSLPARLSIAVLGEFPLFHQLNASESESGPGRPTLRDSDSGIGGGGSVYIVEVFGGETAVLPCPPPPSDPPATLTFFKDGRVITENDRLKMMSSGNLHVINVSYADQGSYTCTAANHITGDLIDGQRILKLVVKSAAARARPLTLTWQPEERYTGQIGHNVTLECAASGWPKPEIRWSREGNRPLPLNRAFYVGGGALVITSLASHDEGTYVCEATNGMAGPALRASTRLVLTEPVTITKGPKDLRVEEGARVEMDCQVKGRPSPQRYWVFNGRVLSNDSNVVITDQQLIIFNVTKRHAGIFQCFVSNTLSKVDGGAATLEVIPRSKYVPPASSNSFHQEEDDGEDDLEDFDLEESLDTSPTSAAPIKPSVPTKGKGGKKNKHRPREMIPPTRPNITRLTDESVMVHWSVPPNEGLPIEFFKVQFKEADKKGSRWKTIDEDIPSHVRSYEVSGLNGGQAYRFRIAAVYTNNDNKLGPNSSRFVLDKEQPRRKPGFSPIIEVAEAVSQSAVMIQWKYPELDSVPVEGFFIYYRSTTSAGEYTKVTVLGGNTRSHIVTHLLPETHYDIKMQAFNMQGTSEFSRILTARTQGSSIYTPSGRGGGGSSGGGSSNNNRDGEMNNNLAPLDVVSSDKGLSNDMLYIVVGSVMGGLTVLVVLLVALYHCRQRSAERERDRTVWSDMGSGLAKPIGNGHSVYPTMPSNHHHPYMTQHHHKLHNGFADQHVPLYVDRSHHPTDNDETAETSFCDGTRSSGDLLRSSDSLPRHYLYHSNSLRRNGGYARNGSTPSLMTHHVSARMKPGDCNTLPLLMQRAPATNGHRIRPTEVDDADWEASVPPADSEKFI